MTKVRRLDQFGLGNYYVNELGEVFNRIGHQMVHQYVPGGYRAVILRYAPKKHRLYRIDHLMGAAFHSIDPLKRVPVLYQDDDFNNVKLENLTFIGTTNG